MRILLAILLLPLTVLAESKLKIGAILPLTGEGAFWGDSARKGIELALKDRAANRAPGEPEIQVIFEDDRCDPKLAVTAFQKLTDLDKVSAIIGPGCSAGAMSAGPMANKSGVPMLTCTEADEISTIGNFVFRMWVPNGRVAVKLAGYAAQNLKAKRLAILTMQNDYGISIAKSGRREFERLGGAVVAEERYIPSSSDLRSELLRIKAKKPDAILVGNYIKDGILIVKQLRELKIDIPVLAGSAANTAEFREAVGSLGDGIIVGDLPDTVPQDFRDRWKKEFGTEWPGMGSCAGMGYDSVGMISSAITAETRTGGEIRAKLAAISNFDGITGKLNFDSEQNLTLTHKLFVLRAGKAEPLPQ